jgi:hypothetical protein
MAGSPLKRQRKLGVRQKDGSIIAFPRMPRVADPPSGWRHFSAAQKIEHLIGLDRCYEILSWPWAGLDPLRRSMKMQVIRVVLPIGIKAMLDGSLDREAAASATAPRSSMSSPASSAPPPTDGRMQGPAISRSLNTRPGFPRTGLRRRACGRQSATRRPSRA